MTQQDAHCEGIYVLTFDFLKGSFYFRQFLHPKIKFIREGFL
jgi:hypothetical protein